MLLTYFDIQDLITDGVVENADPAAINGASLDVTLGDRLYLEDPLTAPYIIDMAKKDRFLPFLQNLSQDEYGPYWLLPPGAFAIAATRERFNLPNNVAIEFKPSLARCGLGHLLAGWRDPGWNNSVLTLEIVNHLRHHYLKLRPGQPIGKIIFWHGRGVPAHASYATRGQYNHDLADHLFAQRPGDHRPGGGCADSFTPVDGRQP